jgi:hydrogenase maturation protease
MLNQPTTLMVIGYGNPGRLDDGLGPRFIERLEEISLPGVTLDSDYQLTIEDSPEVAKHDLVLFVDASVDAPDPFEITELEPTDAMSFTSHSVSPNQVLGMARDLFDSKVRAFTLAIRGHEYNEFGESLSDQAQKNLDAAVEYFLSKKETGWNFEADSK